MASQRDMNLSVAGIEVTIQTDEDRGYMLKLASMVDEKVTTYLKMGTGDARHGRRAGGDGVLRRV